MSNFEWELVTLGEVTTERRTRAGDEFQLRPVYGVDRSFGLTSVAKYSASNLERYKTVENGMFAYNPMRLNIGSIGYCSKDTQPGLVSPDYVVFECNSESLDPDFLSYYINSPDWKEWTANAGVGSVRMRIYYKELARLPFWLPPLNEQRDIVEILSTLDKKIELNHSINRTLDEIAWAIFKKVFVYNENNNEWNYARIGDKLTTYLGGTPSRGNPEYWNNGTIPWINSGKVNEFRIIDATEFITRFGLDSSSTKIVPPRSTVIAITGATLGQVSLLEIEACTNQSVVSVLGSDELPSEFVYFWIKYNIADLVSWQTGGAQQHVNKNNVNDFKILCPDASTMQDFIAQVRPIFDLIRNNCFESRTLASLRDSLLPKLMRGEVMVK